MVKWISLHAAARKGLPMLGRSFAKQKSNCVFYFWAFFWFDIWLVRAWVQETHTGECPRGVLVYVNGGHIWGITEFIQAPEQWSRAGVRCMDTTMHHHLLTSLLHSSSSSLFIDFSLFFFFSLSTGIITWGTYWKFWHAQIWNRSPIFSSILKVSFLFK